MEELLNRAKDDHVLRSKEIEEMKKFLIRRYNMSLNTVGEILGDIADDIHLGVDLSKIFDSIEGDFEFPTKDVKIIFMTLLTNMANSIGHSRFKGYSVSELLNYMLRHSG